MHISDAKNNGIFWDTPYEIDGNSTGIDNFPFVESISDYSASKEKKISGFRFVNIIFFISVLVYFQKKRIEIKELGQIK